MVLREMKNTGLLDEITRWEVSEFVIFKQVLMKDEMVWCSCTEETRNAQTELLKISHGKRLFWKSRWVEISKMFPSKKEV
jgi:hypothetical protein